MIENELVKRIISSVVIIPIVLFVILKGEFYFLSFLTVCFIISSYEWFRICKTKFQKFIGLLLLIFSFISAFYIRNEIVGDYLYFITILFICISTDIGGFIFGRILKGPKLTKISPNKTYSGMFGGYILSLFFIYIYISNYELIINYLNINDIKDIKIINLYLFTFVISSTSQIGDILISYFKRLSKIKDTGSIIPGHGGLLDRIDGMIFAFPMSFLILKLLI